MREYVACPHCGQPVTVSVTMLDRSEPTWICSNRQCPSTHKPATLDDVLVELRAQTELQARFALYVIAAIGADLDVAALALSPEAARSASSPARSASPAASQSSPKQRDCSELGEGAAS